MPFEHGPTGVVRESGGVESAERGGECALHLLYVCELVFCVINQRLVVTGFSAF